MKRLLSISTRRLFAKTVSAWQQCCLVFCVLTAAPACFALSLAPDTPPGSVITDISVAGLTRTKPRVAYGAVEKFLGVKVDELDEAAVYAAVLDLGILEVVSVEVLDSADGFGKTLSVTVREKWTIFPVPLFMMSGDSFRAGGVFADTNAFGLNDKMAAGGCYSTDGWILMAMYNHAASRFLGWHSALFFNRGEVKDTDQVKRAFRSYDRDSWRATAGLNYPITKNVTAQIDALFQAVILREASGRDAPKSGAVLFGVRP